MKEVFYIKKVHHYKGSHESVEIYPEMYEKEVDAREVMEKLIKQFLASGLYTKEFWSDSESLPSRANFFPRNDKENYTSLLIRSAVLKQG